MKPTKARVAATLYEKLHRLKWFKSVGFGACGKRRVIIVEVASMASAELPRTFLGWSVVAGLSSPARRRGKGK